MGTLEVAWWPAGIEPSEGSPPASGQVLPRMAILPATAPLFGDESGWFIDMFLQLYYYNLSLIYDLYDLIYLLI
jgi:hypothetical protein